MQEDSEDDEELQQTGKYSWKPNVDMQTPSSVAEHNIGSVESLSPRQTAQVRGFFAKLFFYKN
jgi:hypothetical protein